MIGVAEDIVHESGDERNDASAIPVGRAPEGEQSEFYRLNQWAASKGLKGVYCGAIRHGQGEGRPDLILWILDSRTGGGALYKVYPRSVAPDPSVAWWTPLWVDKAWEEGVAAFWKGGSSNG